MIYEGDIYRPPSEAESLLLQVTVGCSWNKCTFCNMYKEKNYRVRSLDDIVADLRTAATYSTRWKRIFLCDGDVLALPMPFLTEILEEIKRLFPNIEAARVYASARNILAKKPEELRALAALGADMVYIGLESGSDRVLTAINKGITKQEMIDSAAMLRGAGIKQSVSIIAGLAGEELSAEHILETADALNKMQPEYIGMLVLHAGSDADIGVFGDGNSLRLPSSGLVVAEMRLLLEHLELNDCFFSSAHISNYLNVRGRLPGDKRRMLEQLSAKRRIHTGC
ncbi:MAG: radical SAM protein [Synergistaceae bacterium]|nr:radical SAM protein [Synergistaceae bacterium]